MRHQKQKNSSFGRHRGPRKALIRGLVNSLVENERIKTTVPKAKCTRPLIEKAVTIGKKGDIHSRRLLLSRYPNKKTVDKILNVLSPRFKDRPGGYTRIIKLGFRSGDKAPLAYLEFVDYSIQTGAVKKTKKLEKKEKLTTEGENKKTDSAQAKRSDQNLIKKKSTKADKKKELAKSEKAPDSKKQKKHLLAKIDRKRKKARKQEKKSRRENR